MIVKLLAPPDPVLSKPTEVGFTEVDWNLPEMLPDQIRVRAAMTGVCTSDIDLITSTKSFPMKMSGHEGLGIVVDVGAEISDISIGDFVATRGEPAFADFYNAAKNTYVKVPELAPKYILEPVACGINIIASNLEALRERQGPKSNLLITGSGFIAWCAYHAIRWFGLDFQIQVVGSFNQKLWAKYNPIMSSETFLRGSTQHWPYDVIIELSPSYGKSMFSYGSYLKTNGLGIVACNKALECDVSTLLWNNNSLSFPSPRWPRFLTCMELAGKLVEQNWMEVDYFWTKGFKRETEWSHAFILGRHRPPNYNRGYITWIP